MTMSRLGDFTAQAGAYAARPPYPEPLVDRLVAHVGARAGDPVVDLGAGTGIFTAALARRGLAVTAIEPNLAMRERAPRLDGVTWRAGTFEATGLADRSQKWAVAAQAFHWADPARALPELRRVLRPGGAFTALWNDRDNPASPLLGATMAAIRRLVPEYDHGYRARDWAAVLSSTGDFGPVTGHQLAHRVVMTPARYLDLWRSNNRIAETAGPDRLAALIAAIAELLPDGEVEVPYLCRAFTAIRR